MLMSIKLKPWNKWGVLAVAPHSHFSLVCQGLLPFYCNSKFQSAAQERILAFQSGQLHTHMHSPLNSVLKALWKNACRISKRWLTRFEGMELYEILTTQPGALVEVNLKYAPEHLGVCRQCSRVSGYTCMPTLITTHRHTLVSNTKIRCQSLRL